MIRSRRQAGFTLTELMIAVMLGMSVISSVLVGYLATYSGSVNTLANSKLSQDMTTLMDVMINDIRRAGYSNNPAVATSPSSNTFSQVDVTALEVYPAVDSNAQVSTIGNGPCLVYSYDANRDGAVGTDELFGFRLNAGAVETRTFSDPADPDNPDTCKTASNTWVKLTDPNFMTVTTLNFNLDESECLNTREPDLVDNDADGTVDEADEGDCYDLPLPIATSGNITVETRQVEITLTANLTSDAFVHMSMLQNVTVRNDWVRIR